MKLKRNSEGNYIFESIDINKFNNYMSNIILLLDKLKMDKSIDAKDRNNLRKLIADVIMGLGDIKNIIDKK